MVGKVTCFCKCTSAFTSSHCCALNCPTLLWFWKIFQENIWAEKQKPFSPVCVLPSILSLVSAPLCVTKTHLLARKSLDHLTEDQWRLVTLLYWGKGAIFCGWLNVTVVIFSHHFLLILEIISEICGSLRPAAGGSSWNWTSETENTLPAPQLYCKRQCDIGMHTRCYECRGNKWNMEDSNQCESESCWALYCER